VTTALEIRGLTVRFGGVRAVSDVDLEVRKGQLVGLIGPNGAGKTTFIDAVSGMVRHRGIAVLDGVDISHMTPHRRVRAGLGRTWQAGALFSDLTVRDNLRVAAESFTPSTLLRDLLGRPAGSAEPAIDRALQALHLEVVEHAQPAELSQGQRKLVGVARALVSSPTLVCMDEPAAGLDSSESLALGATLREVVDSGVSALLVEHDMGLVMAVCDYLYVLEFGHVIAHGPPQQVRDDERVRAAYLGSPAAVAKAEGAGR
jgi:branched-chain amino acid transport system ATP-binding protein